MTIFAKKLSLSYNLQALSFVERDELYLNICRFSFCFDTLGWEAMAGQSTCFMLINFKGNFWKKEACDSLPDSNILARLQ
jgi:hypothetical protein